MEVIIFILSYLILASWLWFWRISKGVNVSRSLVIALFTVKIIGALVIWNYYEALEDRKYSDIFKYYDDAQIVKDGILQNPQLAFPLLFQSSNENLEYQKIAFDCGNWETKQNSHNFSGNRFIIRFNAILALVFGSNYFLHLLIFTTISYLGLLLVLNALEIKNRILNSIALVIFTLSPSLFFWTSGILKESLLIFFIGLLFYHIRKVQFGAKNIWSIFLGLFSLMIIWTIRSSVGYCLILALIFAILYYFSAKKTNFPGLISCILLMGISGVFINFNSMDEMGIISERRTEFLELASKYKAQSTYITPIVKHNHELLYKGPLAAYNAILRPNIFELKKITYLPFALESLLLIALFLTGLVYGKRLNKNQSMEVFSIAIFIFSMAVLIGLSTPIFGASVRYRAPLVFLYFISFLILVDRSIFKINKRVIHKINP